MKKSNRDSVFLSYVEKDLGQARNIYEGLIRRGLNVWFDQVDFKHGIWKDMASEAINLSRCLIVCISKAALREMDKSIAGSRNKNISIAYEITQNVRMEQLVIIPVMIEDCFYGNYYLNSLVRYDLVNHFERELNNLAVNLGGRSLSDPDAIDSRN